MKETLIKAKAKEIVRATVITPEIHRPLLKLIKNKAELQVTTSTSLLKHKGLGNCRVLADELFQKQVISLYKHLNSTGTEALATELKLRQGFNDAEKLKFHFNFSSELWQIEQALENCLIGDRKNRKLVPEYVIPGYNLLALSIELLAVSLDKRKKELVLVENKDDDRKIFKIVQKGKAKILGKHYCNILLADPNQFEIKKCKGCSGNTAKMTEKINEEVSISRKEKGFWTGMKKEHPRNLSPNRQQIV
ncbi:32534_t:CDS:2 [Gigaspora margarita]|uniref:32534_t:CDS:1 n=1 Tax=Gigaspora margarita TaxID=4874 RepID=A0ABN7VHX9_GIGMA|nr:32534_t:CDS:2 [Gigaspora margarita]